MIHLFTYLIIFSIILLFTSSILAFKTEKNKLIHVCMTIFVLLWTLWIIGLWIEIDRAPLRTLGETRLWYSYLIPLIGWIMYIQHKWKWILLYSTVLSSVFMIINIVHPENFSKELIPALQSVWFVPHVMVYMFAYAMFGITTMIAFHYLFFIKDKNAKDFNSISKQLIYTGFAFLTLGLTFGALWAKQAWGHYWTWDPKETWALATWLAYLIYIHYTTSHKTNNIKNAIILIFSFVILLLCWFGVNYLPVAANSIHTY